MSIYVSRNNQQIGPLEEAKVLEMLGNGQLSPNDSAIRQGGEWQRLGDMYPNIGNNAAANVAATAANQPPVAAAVSEPSPAAAPKKSRKGLLLGCGGFFLVTILAAAILGFIAYRNLYPADSQENLPDKVKDFKLDNRYPPRGNIWGSETNYTGLYSNASKTQTVIYLLTVYSSESAAKDAFRSELYRSCRTGETPMYFSFVKNSAEVSQGATCAVPLYVQKDNKLVAIGGSGADAETFIEFAENLPFNEGSKMTKKENK